ncbi:DUF4332 domain-containing protein [Halobaculum saliterrae]|uniref:DUF4332 domain-containing protein n=1 Tax=Halobaculum saliterrae TaxID=2073113 RepID=UPI002AA2B6BF|nr:DUF4332 domain-containing protein [Halobaculum saliterrae]
MCEPSLPPPPSEVKPDLPPVLDDVVLPALETDQSDRYQTVYNFADAISTLWDGGYFPPVVARRRDAATTPRQPNVSKDEPSEPDDDGHDADPSAGHLDAAHRSTDAVDGVQPSDANPASSDRPPAEEPARTQSPPRDASTSDDREETASEGGGSDSLTDLTGIGSTRSTALVDAGIESIEEVAMADPATIMDIADFGVRTAADAVSRARAHPAAGDVRARLEARFTDTGPATLVHGVGDSVATHLRSVDIETVSELATADPAEVADETTIPCGTAVNLVSIARDLANSGEHVTALDGIGDKYSERLQDASVVTVEQLAEADPDDLAASLSVSEAQLQSWIDRANDWVESDDGSVPDDPPPMFTAPRLTLEGGERQALVDDGIDTIEALAERDTETIAEVLDCSVHRANSVRRRAQIGAATPDNSDGDSVTAVHGIGRNYAGDLAALGIETVEQLAATPLDPLVAELGRNHSEEQVQEWIDRATCLSVRSDHDSEIPLTDVGGIGSPRAEKLTDLGIENVGEFVAVPPDTLARLLGYGYSIEQIERLQENAESVVE